MSRLEDVLGRLRQVVADLQEEVRLVEIERGHLRTTARKGEEDQMGKEQGLTVEITNGELTIRIGVDSLAWAAEHSDEYFDGCKCVLQVLDNDRFAKDVLRELDREEEDGTTPVHMLLDKAIDAAVNQGSEHCRFDGEED